MLDRSRREHAERDAREALPWLRGQWAKGHSCRLSRPPERQISALRPMAGHVQVFGRRQTQDYPRTRDAGVRKAPKHEVAGEWGTRRCRGRYGDLTSARALEKLSRDRRPRRLGWKLGRGYWRERADGGLLRGICGAPTGQTPEPGQAAALPGESRAKWRASVRSWMGGEDIMRYRS